MAANDMIGLQMERVISDFGGAPGTTPPSKYISGEQMERLIAAVEGNVIPASVDAWLDDNAGGMVDDWLDEHPEATTTVEDGSITAAKLHSDLAAAMVTGASVAPTFSTSSSYSAGDHVWYSGQLYMFLTDHAAGAWNANDATAVMLGQEVEDITAYSRNLLRCNFTNARITNAGVYEARTGTGNCAEAEYIPVESSTAYTFSGDAPASSADEFTLYYAEYASDYSFIKRTSFGFSSSVSSGKTITTEGTTKFIRLYGYKSGKDSDKIFPKHFQLEKGSAATQYVAPVTVDSQKIDSVEAKKHLGINDNTRLASVGMNLFRNNFFYDHMFIDKVNGSDVIIPSESLFNIETAKRLGFTMIEANVNKTSDGVPYALHGVDGKFGGMFGPASGSTDVANTTVSSVNSSWVQTNVRYVSTYDKYKVCPPTLEEWLFECKKLHMIPFVQAYTSDIIELCDKIVGKNNYIAYGAKRSMTDGFISQYVSKSTKQEILDYCDSFGPPFIYSMANPADFTDNQLKEIVEAVHAKGYLISCAASYLSESQTQRLMAFGFDIGGSKYQVNSFESGNLCNLIADLDFSDFSTTGTVASNVLSLASSGTVAPASAPSSVFLGKGLLRIRFNGELKVQMGSYINENISSDGSGVMEFSTYYMNAAPTFLLTAQASTQVYSIEFLASKC